MEMKGLWIINVGSDVKDQLVIRYSTLARYWRKSGNIMGHYISYF
jgi:hypothetical protein